MTLSSSSESQSAWEPSTRRSKRIKTNCGQSAQVELAGPSTAYRPRKSNISFDALIEIPLIESDFEEILPKDNYLATRARHLENNSEADAYGYRIRPLTPAETHGLRAWLHGKAAAGTANWTSGDAILARRLQHNKLVRDAAFTSKEDGHHSRTLTQLPPPIPHSPPDNDTIATLNFISRTPFGRSFASRLMGDQRDGDSYLIHRDTETQAPWMDILSDIRLHYTLSHPDITLRDDPIAPIDYVPLQRCHLPQVHDLLSRTFWPGIDVSDSLQYCPRQCTIICVYKKLVVGAAFLSSPEETYLTYLVVRAGWESANIASVMLYHLITANPNKDITLHVSANNPAMMLYNKFGFKAEEFVVGFYEDYLSSESRACKNAFRLRLRR